MIDLKDDIRELSALIQTLAATLPSNTYSPQSTSTVTIQASGIGVWIASTCCAVMLAVNLFMVALYLDQQSDLRAQRKEIADLGDYLSAIYVAAPQLKIERDKIAQEKRANSP